MEQHGVLLSRAPFVWMHALSVLPGLNSCDDQGNVPLHCAVEKNKLESCRALLDLGADPNILNTALLAPLHLAVSLQHNNLVEVRKPGKKISRCLIYQIKSVYLHSKCVSYLEASCFPLESKFSL